MFQRLILSVVAALLWTLPSSSVTLFAGDVPSVLSIRERAQAVSHSIIADMFSSKVATPGFATTDDLRYYYWQRVADLGLKVSFMPFVSIRGRQTKFHLIK